MDAAHVNQGGVTLLLVFALQVYCSRFPTVIQPLFAGLVTSSVTVLVD